MKLGRDLHYWLWRSLGPARAAASRRALAATIVKVDNIGDFVLALSAIRMLTRHFGEEACALVVANGLAQIAGMEFPRACILELPAGVKKKQAWPLWWKARSRLSAVACRDLVCLRHQRWDYDELMLAWSDAGTVHALRDPQNVKWVRDWRPTARDSAAWREPPAASGLCRELRLHRELVQRVTGRAIAAEEMLPRFERTPAPALSRVGLIAPFASVAIRDIPLELLLGLAQERPVAAVERVVLLGSAGQRARLEALAGKLRAGGYAEVGIETPATLGDFVARVGGAAWVFSAESAAAHVATAWDRPTVVLVGGGHYGQFAPWTRSRRQRWLNHALPCYDCGWRCSQAGPICITRITTAEVATALAEAVAA
jgi:ADP-heptose:LPS heptosyltransferase